MTREWHDGNLGINRTPRTPPYRCWHAGTIFVLDCHFSGYPLCTAAVLGRRGVGFWQSLKARGGIMEASSTSSELELKVLLVGAPKSVRAPLFGLQRSS